MEAPIETRNPGPSASGFSGPAWPVVLWSGWLFAFSPILVDLVAHLRAFPWTRATLVFPFLAWWTARSEAAPVRGSRWGWILVGAGLLIGLLAVAGDVLRGGRVGLVLSAMGLCLATGWASWRAAILLLWSVPVPHVLLDLAEPLSTGFFLPSAIGVARWLGAGVEYHRDQLVSAAGSLEWSPIDGGLPLALMAAGLGWCHAVRYRASTAAALRRSLQAAALALIVQWALVVSVGLALARGVAPTALRAFLDGWPWLGIGFGAGGLLTMGRRPASSTSPGVRA